MCKFFLGEPNPVVESEAYLPVDSDPVGFMIGFCE